MYRGLSENSANRSANRDLEEGSVGEDVSVLTCDQDLYAGPENLGTTEEVYDAVALSQERSPKEGYSPRAYISSPASAFLHHPDDFEEIEARSPTKHQSSAPTARSVPVQSISRSISSPAIKSSTPSARPKSDHTAGSPTTDVVWLIQTLRPEGLSSREDKKRAVSDLKKLAKKASPEFWQRNCAQVRYFSRYCAAFSHNTLRC